MKNEFETVIYRVEGWEKLLPKDILQILNPIILET